MLNPGGWQSMYYSIDQSTTMSEALLIGLWQIVETPFRPFFMDQYELVWNVNSVGQQCLNHVYKYKYQLINSIGKRLLSLEQSY